VVLYDSEYNTERSPINHPILFNIAQYIEREIFDKTFQAANLHKWQFIYADVKKQTDYKDSAIISSKIMHNICQGSYNSFFSEKEIAEFKKKLISLLLTIGITEDYEDEFGSLQHFPL